MCPVSLTSPWTIKHLVPTFSSFAGIDHKRHFRINLIGFSSLAAFLGTMTTFLKKMNKLPDTELNAGTIGTSYLMQNLMLERLALVT